MGENDWIESLTAPLPEEITKLKWCGRFEEAKAAILRRLGRETPWLPDMMRDRLELELKILERLPGQYPYSWEEAQNLLSREIQGFERRELEELWREDGADWIYVEGKVRFRANFLDNLLKTRPEFAARAKDRERVLRREKNQALLDGTMRRMREQGGLGFRFRIHSRMELKPGAVPAGEEVRAYLPLPLRCGSVPWVKVEQVTIGDREAEPGEYSIAGEAAAQRTVMIRAVAGERTGFGAAFSFENRMVYRDFSHGKALERAALECAAAGRGSLDGERAACLGERLPHIRFTPYLRALAAQITEGEENPLLRARRIYDYVTKHVMYSFMRSYLTLTDLLEYAAGGLKGDCGVQALLFITLCRIAGIPARWQSGLSVTPLEAGSHDWAQFYAEPWGWLWADCSFGGSAWRAGDMERWNFYFGNLEPCRMPAAREFQADFEPLMAFLRSDPYDNQRGEAEWRGGSLREEEYETRHQVAWAEEA